MAGSLAELGFAGCSLLPGWALSDLIFVLQEPNGRVSPTARGGTHGFYCQD